MVMSGALWTGIYTRIHWGQFPGIGGQFETVHTTTGNQNISQTWGSISRNRGSI
jgi:hypothetical protein